MPNGTNFSQQFQRPVEHRGTRRVGEEQTMHAHAVERFVARDRSGSTDMRVEIGPNALADPTAPKPDESTHQTGLT